MADYLDQHPDAAMCTVKELHHFGADIQDAFAPMRGRKPLSEDEYLSLFPRSRGEARVGEASVWYLYSEDAPAEILRFEPRAQALIMLRHPADMAHSLHSQLVYLGTEHEHDFEAALALDAARETGTAPRPDGFPAGSYRAAARYAEHVRRYFDAFGREKVHVVLFDDFRADPRAEYRRTCDFLGVDSGFVPPTPVVNPNKRARSQLMRRLTRRPPRAVRWAVRGLTTRSARAATAARLNHLNTSHEPRAPLESALRERLAAELAPDVRRLEELLGIDLGAWGAARETVRQGGA
jgi:hypothetical protein